MAVFFFATAAAADAAADAADGLAVCVVAGGFGAVVDATLFEDDTDVEFRGGDGSALSLATPFFRVLGLRAPATSSSCKESALELRSSSLLLSPELESLSETTRLR